MEKDFPIPVCHTEARRRRQTPHHLYAIFMLKSSAPFKEDFAVRLILLCAKGRPQAREKMIITVRFLWKERGSAGFAARFKSVEKLRKARDKVVFKSFLQAVFRSERLFPWLLKFPQQCRKRLPFIVILW
ncbi:hypothetical protein [Hydrogenispora ethanolica]|uniref:hypothetical protein n=1 Tax=Hydrogenispora ethanolica TaxID=1082276 RepID=UPI001046E999|nr:hypothetical protein [Hydrogenispora ethanolica]